MTFESPPIVIVDIDTLRADHLGCYGYQRATSPNIDAFALESVRFEWVFAQAPNTPPSQASILTGQYPTTHGRIGNNEKIRDDAPGLALELSKAGYSTQAFVDGGLMVSGFGYERGFDLYDDEAGHLATIGPKVFEFLADTAQKARSGLLRPWFLLVHTYDVHSPYEVSPAPFDTYFHSDLDELPSEDYRGRMSEVMAGVWKSREEPERKYLGRIEIEYAKACYDGGVRHVDDWFGELLRKLKKLGLYENSIIVVISDHGDEFQEQGGLFHERVYSPVARIPLIIRFPGALHGGVVVDEVVQSIDLMPTILESIGLATPNDVQGRSLVPLIEAKPLEQRSAFTESPYFGRRIAVATRRHRLIKSVDSGGTEVFDYRVDTLEQNALADPDEALRKALEQEIAEWEKLVESGRAVSTEGPEWSPEQLEQLKVLGYVD